MLTKNQTRVHAALRKGSSGALKFVREDDQPEKLVSVKAVDVLELCDAIDTLQAELLKLKPAAPADPAPAVDAES